MDLDKALDKLRENIIFYSANNTWDANRAQICRAAYTDLLQEKILYKQKQIITCIIDSITALIDYNNKSIAKDNLKKAKELLLNTVISP